MKKLYFSLAALLLIAGQASAGEGSVAGGFEASGHVDVVVGYMHTDQDAGAVTALGGAVGEFLGGANGANDDTFQFFIDSVELDLAKSFGENIRARADIDFGTIPESGVFPAQSGAAIVNLEQAYVTTNVALGNGGEFLVGLFNAPIGFDPVDRPELHTVSHSDIFSLGIVPVNVTGAKFYYAFGDLIDLNIYVVNDLTRQGAAADSVIPSGGARLGFTWGEEGSESTFGISAAAGPEQGQMDDIDMLGDIDFALQVTDNLLIGGEGIYRQRNSDGATADAKVLAGQLVLNYAFSEVWDGTFRYEYTHDVDDTTQFFSAVGSEQIQSATIAAGYQIADGAKFKLEYQFEFANPNAGNSADFHSVVAEYAYNF